MVWSAIKGAVGSGMRELGIGRPGVVLPEESRYAEQQQQMLSGLRDAASGRAPSAAEVQQRRGIEQAMQSAIATNKAQRGFGVGSRTAQMQRQMADTGLAASSQAAQLRAQEQATARQQYAQAVGQAAAQDQAYQMALAEAQRKGPEALRNFLGGLAGAGAQAVGMAAGLPTSDIRKKEDIREGDRDIEKFLDAISPSSYNMTDGRKNMTGVMAQDMEKTPAGRAAVSEEGGTKRITPDALSLALAANANLHERLKKIEDQEMAKAFAGSRR